ncbi:hypothetical protein SAMN05444008_11843 [Cnuella takakiae]|uniref:Peptidase family M50 n=1 Tax=Cnuella takakiae TaxID=1302690 RepID=A0A1M5H5M9_9BACT|nr:hypothetical protein [Cnuella takakiae]OLY91102.1 hypothetical protein BUE76_03685 [Cnuella takakiae]SHG11297.1 hypothetical protein SAMN05444008_11843 [Cnuella takakiae]
MLILAQPIRINPAYLLITVVVVVASWLLHEGAHYLAGIALGYPMAMTLNTAYPVSGSYNSSAHEQWISAAGPLFTLLSAILVFVLMGKGRRPLLYPVLFTAFYMRLLAGIISLFNPNDEARISSWLGLGRFTLPLLVVAILGWLLYKRASEQGVSRRVNWVTLLVVMVVASAIVLSDQFFRLRLL